MERGGRRALWLTTAVLATSILAASLHVRATEAGGGQQGPDTAVLCASKCATCPTVCSSPPPPPPPAPSSSSYGAGAGVASPTTPSCSVCGGGLATSPPGGQSKGAGGHPSSYYYMFTAGGVRRAGYAPMLTFVFVSLAAAAGFQ